MGIPRPPTRTERRLTKQLEIERSPHSWSPTCCSNMFFELAVLRLRNRTKWRKGLHSLIQTRGKVWENSKPYINLRVRNLSNILGIFEIRLLVYLEIPEFWAYLEMPTFWVYLEMPTFWVYFEIPTLWVYFEIPTFWSYLEIPPLWVHFGYISKYPHFGYIWKYQQTHFHMKGCAKLCERSEPSRCLGRERRNVAFVLAPGS